MTPAGTVGWAGLSRTSYGTTVGRGRRVQAQIVHKRAGIANRTTERPHLDGIAFKRCVRWYAKLVPLDVALPPLRLIWNLEPKLILRDRGHDDEEVQENE